MTQPIIPREQVARELTIPPKLLVRYERMGFIRASRKGKTVGYEPSQIRRLWTILSFQRDLGINLAGVEVILKLCDQMTELHHRLASLAIELRQILDEDETRPAPGGPREEP